MLSTHLKILNQNISRRRQMASFRVKLNAKRCDLSTHLEVLNRNISRRRQMASFRAKPNAKRCDLSTHFTDLNQNLSRRRQMASFSLKNTIQLGIFCFIAHLLELAKMRIKAKKMPVHVGKYFEKFLRERASFYR